MGKGISKIEGPLPSPDTDDQFIIGLHQEYTHLNINGSTQKMKCGTRTVENMDQKIILKSLEVVQQNKKHLSPPVYPDVLHLISSISSLVEIPSPKKCGQDTSSPRNS